MNSIIYKELSYQVIGCIFKMFNEVGFGYREKHYQKILAEIFKNKKLTFQRELIGRIIYNQKIISRYYLDFLVENKIIVELKIANDFYNKYIVQVLTYLKAHNIKLGILVLITRDGVKYKRLLNSQFSD